MTKVNVQEVYIGDNGEEARSKLYENDKNLSNGLDTLNKDVSNMGTYANNTYAKKSEVANLSNDLDALNKDMFTYAKKSDVAVGTILKGILNDNGEFPSNKESQRGDTYKVMENGHYYTYDGQKWNDIGEILPSDVVTKKDIVNSLTTGGVNKPLSAEMGKYISVGNSNKSYPFTSDGAREYPDLAKCIVDLKITKGTPLNPYVFAVGVDEQGNLNVIHIRENDSLVLHGGDNAPVGKIGNITYYNLYSYNESGYEGYIGIDLSSVTYQDDKKAYLSPLCWDEKYRTVYDLSELSEFIEAGYIYAFTDKEGKVLIGHKNNGEFYCYGLDKNLQKLFGITSITQLTDITKTIKLIDNDKYVYCFCDSENKILYAIKTDGTVYQYGENNKQKEDTNRLNLSNETKASIPFPTSASKIYITSPRIGDLTTSKNSVRATIELITDGGYFKKQCDIAYQGSSSIQDPKKNFGIDLLNDDESSFKLKIGNLRHFDSFHLKAYYQDKNRLRNNISARLVEQIDLSRSLGNQRAWDYLPKTAIKDYINTGARGHIEGFPCEMYINGEFAGLYYWNLKKHRDNYNQEKSNPKHIRLEWQHGDFSLPVRWDRIEISNPKGFTSRVEPPGGDLKTYIVNFWNNLNAAASKADLEAILNIPFWVDYYIFYQFMAGRDSSRQNIQLCTWDGDKWAALWYDMDVTFGAWETAYNFLAPRKIQNGDDWDGLNLGLYKIVKYYAPEISARYVELRDMGILTYKNVENLFRNEEKLIGIDLLNKEFEKWDYGDPNSNPSVTHILQWMQKRIPVLDKYFTKTILTEVLS